MAVRQWKILKFLESSRVGHSIGEIHQAVAPEVSERTVRRDVEALEQAGFRLERERGLCRLDERQHAPELKLEDSHILALQLALPLLAPARGTPLHEPLTELEQRLRLGLSDVQREGLAELRRYVAATVSRPALLSEGLEAVVEEVQIALDCDQVIRMIYGAPGHEPSERVIHPYATWIHDGRSYVVGWCTHREAYRTFLMQRIQEVEVLEEKFERRADFELSQFTHQGFGVLHGEVKRAVIEFLPGVAHVPRERVLHPSQEVEPLPSGGTRVTLEVAGHPELAAYICSFGGEVIAVEPPELKEEVLRRYRNGLEAQAASD